MRVAVYRNLHKQCWSVVAMEGDHKGKVIAHTQNMLLADCSLRVSAAGNAKVRREKRKNVHAKIHGILQSNPNKYLAKAQQISYNPYSMTTFETMCGAPVHEASYVKFAMDLVLAVL